MTSRYRYLHLDVFTGERFGGNQLAVFLDARGPADRDDAGHDAEMNFSESTFILPAERPGHRHPDADLHAGARDAHGGPPDRGIHVRAGARRRHSRRAGGAGSSA